MELKYLFWVCIVSVGYVDGRGNRVRRIVGGHPAAVPTDDEPIAYVNHARRSARVRGVLEYPHYVFRGVRYAYAPTGRDRFQRPKQYLLEGEYNATEYPPSCLQPIPGTDKSIGSEDCLFLNIHTPTLPEGNEGLPVLLFIHPGGFRYGSASQFGVRYLIRHNIIVVAIQYRLGSLGFLSTGTAELPGNAAIFDMALAVEWTRRYIGFFGGNPHRITVMGHGSGASSALLLALSDVAKGVPSGVIAMSGTAVSTWAIDNDPAQTAKDIADYQGCPTVNALTMIRCLQNIKAEAIIKGDSYMESFRMQKRGFISSMSGLLSASPVAEGVNDGRSLPSAVQHQPLDDMYLGRAPKIPLLTGITKDETKKAVHGQFRDEATKIIQSVPDFFEKNVIPTLQSLVGLGTKKYEDSEQHATGFWKTMDPLNFRSYLKVNKDNILDSLGAISEATGDALFNLPAFLTADLWSKNKAPTYLYRFDHVGKARKGNAFLKGLHLVDNEKTDEINDTCSHGDDLSYLFEARNLDGTNLKDPENFDKNDEKVRDIYSKMIADFVIKGKLEVNKQLIPTFTDTKNNFVEINANPKISDSFQFCQMALWAGMGERLQSATCQILKQIENVQVPLVRGLNTSLSQINPLNVNNSWNNIPTVPKFIG